jgi:CHAT domain-containing protein
MHIWRCEKSLGIVLLGATLLLVGSLPISGQSQMQARQSLLANAPVEVEVIGDQRVRYEVELTPGEFFQARVQQKDSEILLRLLDAGNNEVARMSSPKEMEGLETISFVATETASYTLEVGLLNVQSQKGNFVIWRERPRAATEQDKRRVEVERLFAEGMTARDATGQAKTATKKFSEALEGWRELRDEYMVQLCQLLVIRSQGRAIFLEARKLLEAKQPSFREALAKFQESGRLFKAGGEAVNEGASLLGAALASQGLGDLESTIAFVELAVPIFSNKEGALVKAQLLDILGAFYLVLNDINTALNRFLESRSIYNQLQLPEDEARAGTVIGSLYMQIGNFDDAYKSLDSARELRVKNGSRCGLPSTLTHLGVYYYYVNEKAKAREFLLDRSLPLYPPGDECAGDKAQTLISIGQFYYDLGAHDFALKYLSDAGESLKKEAEALSQRDAREFDVQMYIVHNKRNQASALNYVGAAKFALAKYQEASISLSKSNVEKAAEAHNNAMKLYADARSAYEEALKLYRETSDKKHEATVMTNIGVVQSASGQINEALKIFDDALKVSQEADDKDAEGITLNNIGEAYSKRGEHRRALDFFKRALPLFRAVGDKSGQAVALSAAMYDWSRVGNRRMAIFSGKQAISIFQELRGAARGLETEIQKDYLRGIRDSYQRLAQLLIEEGLYAQAVQILNLYQDQQFFDLARKASVDGPIFSPHEYEWLQRYDTESRQLAQLNSRIEEGKRQQIANRLSADSKNDQLQTIRREFKNAAATFFTLLETNKKEFAQPPDNRDRVAEIKPVTRMQNALEDPGNPPQHKSVALYTLVGNNKFYVLLLTPTEIKAFSYTITADDLNRSIIKVLSDLKNSAFPEKIRLSSSSLYGVILGTVSIDDGKSTLEAELDKFRPDTLLWSLDGILSYLPVAALYDAKKSQYLLEKFQNVAFTRADADRILRRKTPWKRAIGFGKSTTSEVTCDIPCDHAPCGKKLKFLPLVTQEMAAIFGQAPKARALIKGTIVLNQRFTRDRMLQARNTPLVHIASHFCFQPGDASGSFLLLGDDSKFSLHEMNNYPDLYAGVDLLVLSACQTAALERNQFGKEIDSLAELSQRLGAASVIATLWNADEIGASRLMIKFYTLHKLKPEMSKAELLRQAQLSLLKGRETAPNLNLDHPYYWAPFVLYGSFR